MQLRMPRFSKPFAKTLAGHLTTADLPPEETPPPPAKQVFSAAATIDAERLTEAGRRLLDTGCVQCHPVQGEALPGVIGVDLGEIAERVQPAWFRDFLRDPGSLKPRTRMPTFFPDGKSQDASILEGSADLQIAALWHYLKRSASLPLPEKIREARSQNYELKPTDHPLLLRTFMPQVGTHAIAVGFPAGRHYAFDAETNRLATLWSGRFLDAQGTWFVRFAPPADPLGQAIVLPTGFPFRQTPALPTEPSQPAAASSTFRGYRLDEAGVPTVLYRWHGWEVEDRLVPTTGEAGFQRRLVLTRVAAADRSAAADRGAAAATDPFWFRVHAGESLQPAGPRGYRDPQGLVVRLPRALADKAKLLAGGTDTTAKEWWLPVEPTETNESIEPQRHMIEVEYRW
jgi:mono/diheme cytochrome c family protein